MRSPWISGRLASVRVRPGPSPITMLRRRCDRQRQLLGVLPMKFFLDTANIDQIKAARDLGVLDGITTNPSLVSKEGREFKGLIAEICKLVPGPVSAEVTSIQCDGMMKEARDLIKIAPNVVVKLPTIAEGVKALVRCRAENIKVQ